MAFTIFLSQQCLAGTLYYDTNEASTGTATSSTQDFTDPIWTTDSTGSITTLGYTPDSDVVFSAGTNGTGSQNITITDAESVDGFTFDNGTVTLFGSGSPNLSLGGDGITVNSDDGATTLDSTLGTVALTADQTWNNDSTQALNVGSGISGSSQTLTFDGTGSGSVNLNGVVSGDLSLAQDSASSAVYLNNGNNSFTGEIAVNGGSVIFASAGALGNSANTIDLGNDGTLEYGGSGITVSNNIVIGSADVGQISVGGFNSFFTGTVSGGTLNVINGTLITQSSAASNISTINVLGEGRLLAEADGIFGNDAAVNVGAGSTLALQLGNDTLNNTITLADGSALVAGVGESGYINGTVTLTNVVFPTTGTVTLGSDDAGDGSEVIIGGAAMTISSDINLTGSLTLDLNSAFDLGYFYYPTIVTLAGDITGAGSLTVNPGRVGNSPLYLAGDNKNFSGPIMLNGVTVYPEGSGFGSSTVTLNQATVELTGGTIANTLISNTTVVDTGGTIDLAAGSGAETTSGIIKLIGSTTQNNLEISNHSSSGLTLGDIDVEADPGSGPGVNSYNVGVDSYGTGGVTFDGTYTSDFGNAGGNFGPTGLVLGANSLNSSTDFYITPTANFSNFQPSNLFGEAAIALWAGTLYLDNSSFVLGQTIAMEGGQNSSASHTIDVVGAQTIDATIYGDVGTNVFTVNQSTPDESTWAGDIEINGGDLVVSAVEGGRLNISGNLDGDSPNGIVKSGAGTVVFSNPIGNNYDYNVPGSSVSLDVQQGTLLIESQEGYALGIESGVVKIEKGATFGGSGNTGDTQQIVAEDPGSIIAPGDAGQANLGIAPAIGTLTLPGGITAENGLTLDFKLNGDPSSGEIPNEPGVNNDFISVGNMTLNGTITINLTAVGNVPLLTGYGNFFVLIEGAGDWTKGNPTFIINAPAGYALDPSFGTPDGLGDGNDLGYVYDTVGRTFAVQLIAVPEPSAYGLLGVSLMALTAVVRFGRLRG